MELLIINGVPYCFSNKLKKGTIGLVAASGTGCQEVMTLVDKLGGGTLKCDWYWRTGFK